VNQLLLNIRNFFRFGGPKQITSKQARKQLRAMEARIENDRKRKLK